MLEQRTISGWVRFPVGRGTAHPAELSIGDTLDAHKLLERDEVDDALVLDLLELLLGDLASVELGTESKKRSGACGGSSSAQTTREGGEDDKTYA